MGDKVPQSTPVLVKRLRRVAKMLANVARVNPTPERWHAAAHTCWQSAGRLEDLDAKQAEAESYIAHLEEHGNL